MEHAQINTLYDLCPAFVCPPNLTSWILNKWEEDIAMEEWKQLQGENFSQMDCRSAGAPNSAHRSNQRQMCISAIKLSQQTTSRPSN